MLSNDCSETSFELWAHAVAAVDANDAAAISVSEMNFGVPTGLINLTYLESRPTEAHRQHVEAGRASHPPARNERDQRGFSAAMVFLAGE